MVSKLMGQAINTNCTIILALFEVDQLCVFLHLFFLSPKCLQIFLFLHFFVLPETFPEKCSNDMTIKVLVIRIIRIDRFFVFFQTLFVVLETRGDDCCWLDVSMARFVSSSPRPHGLVV